MKNFLVPAFMLGLLFTACKKDKDENASTPPPPPPPTEASAADKLKDTTLLYARDIYLWHDKIPATFNARSHADPSAIMTAIRQYATEPGFSASVDRWSFAASQQDW